MKRHMILTTMSVIALAVVLLPVSTFGQDTPAVTGAGLGVFPSGTLFSGITVSALQFGMGVFIEGSSTTGQFQTTLLGTTILGQTRNIEVEGKATNGSINPGSSGTFSGTATVDMGDGTPPVNGVPFSMTVTPSSLLLVLGGVNLPAATLTEGTITIQ